jgi:hypothetical protein
MFTTYLSPLVKLHEVAFDFDFEVDLLTYTMQSLHVLFE